MLAAFLLSVLLLTAAVPARALEDPATSALTADLREAASFGPRSEGSPSESALLDWIATRAAGGGRRVTRFDFSSSDFEHSFSANLRVEVPGRSTDSLILAVPIDSVPGAPRGQDGSAGIALALDLLDHTKGSTPPLTLVVLFLGAEFGDGPGYPMGSRLVLQEGKLDPHSCLLYLDLRAVPRRVRVRGGGPGIVSPFWIMKRLRDALDECRVSYRLPVAEIPAFRLGATYEHTLIEPWLQAGIPSIGLAGEYGGGPAPSDMMPSLACALRAMLSSGRDGIPGTWDRHYLLEQFGRTTIMIGETTMVAIVGGALSVLLLAGLVTSRRLKKYLRTLLRNAGAIPPLAGFAFVFLAAATYAVSAIPTLRRFPGLWRYAPAEFLGLKLAVALLLYALLSRVRERLPFPRNGSFYSASALLFLLVELGAVAVFDISFAPYFLWALLFVFLSTLARNKWAKLLLVLPAPLWILRWALAVSLLPALPLTHALTLSLVQGNLLLAGACLPFMLVLVRLGLVFPGRGILRRGSRELVLAAVLAAAVGAESVRLLVFSPFSLANPQPITATQTIVVDAAGRTSSTTLGVDSPAPVRGLRVATSDRVLLTAGAWSQDVILLAPAESPLRVQTSRSEFLQQENLTLRVHMPTGPRSFTLQVDSPQDFVLYDSSFPSVRTSPRSYRLLVGGGAPDPLVIEVSLPIGRVFSFTLTAEFDAPLIDVQITAPPDARVATRLRVVRTLEVHT